MAKLRPWDERKAGGPLDINCFQPRHPMEQNVYDAIIQGEVQRAIASKNWWLNLSTFTAIPSAKIQKPDDPVWGVHHGSGESLAVAILKAYISCLEGRS